MTAQARGDRGMPLPLAGRRPERVNTADAVYRLLRQAILGGQLAPGRHMREVDLADQLGVSRTPLREAIARLIGDRLVRRARGGGVEVIDLIAELVGVRHIRVALEGYAARLAAERIGIDDLARLEALVERSECRPGEALEARVRVNNEFHALVYRACAIPQLIQAIETYRDYFIDEDGLQRFGPEETRKAVAAHRDIFTALAARDGEAAERLTRAHLLSAFDTLMQQ